MSDTHVLVQLADKIQYDMFGAFIKGNNILLAYTDNLRFVYKCTLNDFQLLICKTHYKAVVTELD